MPDALGMARAWLARARNPDGTWGYLPGRKARPEPTLLSAIAGMEAPLSWLSTADLGWARRLVPLALADRPDALRLVRQAVLALEKDQALAVEGPLTFDTAIPAWGWVEGTAAWVEPTATAVLSLRRAGRGGSPRVVDGIRMLLNRQDRDGGWNHGNPTMLGQDLESFPETTAWALMAIQAWPGAEVPVERGFTWLSRQLDLPTTLGMALFALALDAHGRDPEDALTALVRRQDPNGSWLGRVDLTALAAAALMTLEGSHAFRV